MSEILHSWVEKTLLYERQERERQIRLVIQPKPRWMPSWLWNRLLARMLVLEEGQRLDP